MRLGGRVLERLRRTWYGSALALVGLAILTVVPAARHCVGIAAVRGGQGGIFCSWRPPLESPGEPGLILLVSFAIAILVIPLAFPQAPVVLVTGIATAAIVIALLVVTTISFDIYFALERLGLRFTGDADTALLALLPASIAWIVASFRLWGRPAR